MRRLPEHLGAMAAVAGGIIVACRFNPPQEAPGLDDAPVLVDAYVPDASACAGPSVECAGPVLRTCTDAGQLPTDTPCTWGCSTNPSPHCALLQPSGGVLQPDDLVGAAGLEDKTLMLDNTRLDTDTGEIAGVRAPGPGIIAGIEYIQRSTGGVFRFQKLTLNGNRLDVVGSRALAIVAIDGVTINARIDMTGDCSSSTPGAGGFAGGARGQKGSGAGGGDGGDQTGTGGNFNASGGGGGGYGGKGGKGGNGQTNSTSQGGNGGDPSGDEPIAMLVGGAGGGGGGGPAGDAGGGGGGAIQIVSNGTIRVAVKGIDAGGCGGLGTTSLGHGAGGGGAGGAILLEAPIVEVAANAVLAVNGGGGGGADGINNDGQVGQESLQRANGGNSGGNGGDGGDGGANTTFDGSSGGTDKFGGGGGGAVGRIRINTLAIPNAQVSANAIVSPPFSVTDTTSTLGLAAVE